MVQTWTHGIDMDSGYRHGLMVQKWTHGIDIDSWYGHGVMELKKNHSRGKPGESTIFLNPDLRLKTTPVQVI